MGISYSTKGFLDNLRAEDHIGGCCPCCQNLFRLSEITMFHIPDRRQNYAKLRINTRELEEHEREDTDAEHLIKSTRDLIREVVEKGLIVRQPGIVMPRKMPKSSLVEALCSE